MRRLPLRRKLAMALGAAALLAAVLAFALAAGALPFLLVDERSPELQLAPLGFDYRGAPLSGVIYGFHPGPGWNLSRLTVVRGGKLHGPDLQWFANSQRSVERHYEQGLETGTHKAWYASGRVRSLKRFEAGTAHGEFYDWHDNGQLSQFVVYDHGREIAAKSWTAGGKPFYNYVRKDQLTIGLRGDTYCSPRKKP